jgi:hypothetical protein
MAERRSPISYPASAATPLSGRSSSMASSSATHCRSSCHPRASQQRLVGVGALREALLVRAGGARGAVLVAGRLAGAALHEGRFLGRLRVGAGAGDLAEELGGAGGVLALVAAPGDATEGARATRGVLVVLGGGGERLLARAQSLCANKPSPSAMRASRAYGDCG